MIIKKVSYAICIASVFLLVGCKGESGGQLLGAALSVAGGTNRYANMPQYDLQTYLRPINDQLSATQNRIDKLYSTQGWSQLVAKYPKVFKGRQPAIKGMTGVYFDCYSEGGVVDPSSCQQGKERGSSKATLKVLSIAPQYDAGNRLIPFAVRETMIEIATVDPNQPGTNQVYFFGNPKFDLIYITRLSIAIKQAGFRRDVRSIGQVVEATRFTVAFLRLLTQLGSGGAEILKKTTGAFENPQAK